MMRQCGLEQKEKLHKKAVERKKVYNGDFCDMKKVCVVTGGGSWNRFCSCKKEAAKKRVLCNDSWTKEKKLACAVEELRKDGCEAEAYSCDVSDREHCFGIGKACGRMWGCKGRVAYCRNESAYGRCGENHAGKRTWNRQYQRCIF